MGEFGASETGASDLGYFESDWLTDLCVCEPFAMRFWWWWWVDEGSRSRSWISGLYGWTLLWRERKEKSKSVNSSFCLLKIQKTKSTRRSTRLETRSTRLETTLNQWMRGHWTWMGFGRKNKILLDKIGLLGRANDKASERHDKTRRETWWDIHYSTNWACEGFGLRKMTFLEKKKFKNRFKGHKTSSCLFFTLPTTT